MISAILPVANAFVVLLIFSSVFAVMAVMFFGKMESSQNLFNNFSISLFTMFQVYITYT
jgi:hypothetical protein